MSWLHTLGETYDNYFAGPPLTDDAPLTPVGFVRKALHLRVDLRADGSFLSASVLADKPILPVPSSPEAEGRTGTAARPYPLCDELRYVAGDLSRYSDTDYRAYANAYREQLRAWCAQPQAPAELHALLRYLGEERLAADLIHCGLLWEEGGKLLKNWPTRHSKPAFFQLGLSAEKCLVDFYLLQGTTLLPLREIAAVQHSWQEFLLASLTGRQLCYASGEMAAATYNHAKVQGNAKLISAKDGPRDFQFKGRFVSTEQAYSLSYLASAKAHSALSWLSGRQGFHRYGVTFVAWSTSCRPIIQPQDDAESVWGAMDEDDEKLYPQTEQAYAAKVNQALAGYAAAPPYSKTARIVMLGMEAATPGRMSINFYQELDGRAYLDGLALWYTRCQWLLPRYNKTVGKTRRYVTTPNLYELGEAVFGPANMRIAALDGQCKKSITKQVRGFNQNILSRIVNQQPMPLFAARSAFHRACRPDAFTDAKGKWQRDAWLKCLAVACAMQKSCYEKEEYTLTINKAQPDTSRLFGQLLAVADCVEIFAMAGSDTPHRQTNAIRYFSAMQQRPAATWQVLEDRLQPYLTKLKDRGERKYRRLLDEITHSFPTGEIANNSPLTPHFLEGYHNQRYELLNNK